MPEPRRPEPLPRHVPKDPRVPRPEHDKPADPDPELERPEDDERPPYPRPRPPTRAAQWVC